ncbi:GNAT family N-acetyltransferase [Paenibacillus sp. 32O-W]|uniref:GNAT family N-acetyltransferase n=1 Tax=Paenibacillus sp. 32O-W TaxID=1695218 RepID=UPI00119CDB4F|nr:GNAT family N-acetyltransferase [Paenibacillus sp. 32O-W]
MKIVEVQTQEELDQCLSVRKEVFVIEQKVPEDLEIDEYDRSPGACSHWLALDGSNPAGTGRWIFYGEEADTAKLQRLAILSRYRGTGLGSRLLNALENSAREAGAQYAVLDGQCHTEAFYVKHGYVTVSKEPFLEAGIWHVRMRKRL